MSRPSRYANPQARPYSSSPLDAYPPTPGSFGATERAELRAQERDRRAYAAPRAPRAPRVFR